MVGMGREHALQSGETWQTFLGMVRTGKPFGKACRAVGCTRRAVSTFLEGHPDKAAEYLEAELDATEAVEEGLYECALAKERWAVTMWLERRDGDRWAPSASVEGPGRLVLDPAALRQMALPAAEPAPVEDAVLVETGIGVVHEDGVEGGGAESDVVTADVEHVDTGSA